MQTFICLADNRFIFCSKRKKAIEVEFLFGALGPGTEVKVTVSNVIEYHDLLLQ
jgi:hypothetical protein